MVYSVKIHLGPGTLEQGFDQVQIQLKTPSKQEYFPIKARGWLPPAPELAQNHRLWQGYYPELLRFNQLQAHRDSAALEATPRLELRIDPEEPEAQRFSVPEFQQSCYLQQQLLNQWLNTESFSEMEKDLCSQIPRGSEVHILIEVNAPPLCQLPWHLWTFFDRYPKAEVSFCLPKHAPPQLESRARPKVRVLALLGDLEGVDAQGDLKALEQFPNTEVKVVAQPSRQKFETLLWDQQGWDILFYGGHSRTEAKQGRLFINSQDSLTLDEFSEALKVAITRGTMLAIFNSCDGLGLAQVTAELGLPATLIMLQSVPNGVAVPFVHHFLHSFIQGASCYQALRDARRRLQGIEDRFHCASWMPGMFRNPTEPALTWDRIRNGDHQVQERRDRRRSLLASVGVAAGVILLSSVGWLQWFEWKAYDAFLMLRPPEPLDERLLVVKVTPEDLKQLDQTEQLRLNFLPETDLNRLLQILKQHYQPQMIGLDFKQQAPVESDQLKQALQHDQVLAVCGTVRHGGKTTDVVTAPPDMELEQVGFSDFWPDSDRVLRRFIYETTPAREKTGCETPYAFSLLMALNYLDRVYPQQYPVDRTDSDDLQVGSTVLKTLAADFGGYQLPKAGADGWQMLLNYRAGGKVAKTMTLSEVLATSGEQRTDLQNRIILVGGDINDHHPTPWHSKTSGVEVHAHMTSQILSAVLDGRPLIATWPLWAECLWIVGWSAMGGGLIWVWRQRVGSGLTTVRMSARSFLTAVGMGVVLVISGYGFLCLGLWVPVVAPLIALVVTSGGVILYRIYSRQ